MQITAIVTDPKSIFVGKKGYIVNTRVRGQRVCLDWHDGTDEVWFNRNQLDYVPNIVGRWCNAQQS